MHDAPLMLDELIQIQQGRLPRRATRATHGDAPADPRTPPTAAIAEARS